MAKAARVFAKEPRRQMLVDQGLGPKLRFAAPVGRAIEFADSVEAREMQVDEQ